MLKPIIADPPDKEFIKRIANGEHLTPKSELSGEWLRLREVCEEKTKEITKQLDKSFDEIFGK